MRCCGFLLILICMKATSIQTWEECHVHLTNTELHQEICQIKSDYIDFHSVNPAEQSIMGLSRRGTYDLQKNPSRNELSGYTGGLEMRSFPEGEFIGTGMPVMNRPVRVQVTDQLGGTMTADDFNQSFDPETYTLFGAQSLNILFTATLPNTAVSTLNLDRTDEQLFSAAGLYMGFFISNLASGFGLDVFYRGNRIDQIQRDHYNNQFISAREAFQNYPVTLHFLNNEFPQAYARIQTCAGDFSMSGVVYILVCPYWELDWVRTYNSHVRMRSKGFRQWIRRKLDPNPTWRNPVRAAYQMLTF